MALLPDDTHVVNPGTEDAHPNTDSLRNDNNFRHDCARYCEDIELGKHDPDWLREAWIAHTRRNRGDFDDHIVQQFEADWDVELPEAHYPKALRDNMQQQQHGSPAGQRDDDEATEEADHADEGDATKEAGLIEEADPTEEEQVFDSIEVATGPVPKTKETAKANGATKPPKSDKDCGEPMETDEDEDGRWG